MKPTTNEKMLLEVAELMWVALAHVSGGNWQRQSKKWIEVASKAREGYHNCLQEFKKKGIEL